MQNKKLYTAEEAAQWILEEIPSDLSDEVESSGSDDDDDFVLNTVGFSDPIADKSGDEGDEDVAVEGSWRRWIIRVYRSSSEEEVEVDASIAGSTIDTNITDTNPNDAFRGNVDINIEHYDVD